MVSFLAMHCNSMSLCPVSGAIGVSAGSAFSDVSREVFLVSPDCVGNESSLMECSQNLSLPCAAQGGVGAVCQGMYLHGKNMCITLAMYVCISEFVMMFSSACNCVIHRWLHLIGNVSD